MGETHWKKIKEIGFNWNRSKVLDENEIVYKPVGQIESYP
jgi:hypothetical protein